MTARSRGLNAAVDIPAPGEIVPHTPETLRRAAMTVACNATSTDDARELLAMLGLLEGDA